MSSSLDRRRFIVMSSAGALRTRSGRARCGRCKGSLPLPGPSRIATGPPVPICYVRSPACSSWPSVPGLALGVVTDGQVWKGGFGRATLEPVTPVSYETVFEAVSLGKPLFAYAVLRLVDAGRIDLDRPLYDYLPSPEANNPRMRKVTATQCSPTPPVCPTGGTNPARSSR